MIEFKTTRCLFDLLNLTQFNLTIYKSGINNYLKSLFVTFQKCYTYISRHKLELHKLKGHTENFLCQNITV